MSETRWRQRQRRKGNPLGTVLNLAVGAAGAWILYSNYWILHKLPLADAIRAERQDFVSATAGRLSYYADRAAAGRPLVLLHSINAAASAFEMRPLFDHYRNTRPIYALDWAGYGFSERTARAYSPQFFQEVLIEFLEKQVGQAADVIALSLGSEFAARAALARPDLFRSLVLISPSGLGSQNQAIRVQARTSNAGDKLHSFLSFRLWGRPLFDLIATRASIEYFLQKSFVGNVPPEMIEYAYATSHQPGAEIVPLHFISRKLFTPNVAEAVYLQLTVPTLVLFDRDPYTRFDELPNIVRRNPKWQAQRIAPSLGLPHWERLDAVTQSTDAFWNGVR